MYIGWIIAALTALACGVMTAAWRRAQRQLREIGDQTREEDGLRRELAKLRNESGRLHRENAALKRALSGADQLSEDLEAELGVLQERLDQAENRVEAAEHRRSQAEKDIYAVRMKGSLLEKELADERESRRVEEEMYQEILRERDAELRRLQGAVPKKRHKKPDVLDRQITFDELLQI